MPIKNPPHPGEIVRDSCIEPLGLSVTKAAEGLGVTSKTLSLLLNGHAGISAIINPYASRNREGYRMTFVDITHRFSDDRNACTNFRPPRNVVMREAVNYCCFKGTPVVMDRKACRGKRNKRKMYSLCPLSFQCAFIFSLQTIP